jgi:hypothetical protein
MIVEMNYLSSDKTYFYKGIGVDREYTPAYKMDIGKINQAKNHLL